MIGFACESVRNIKRLSKTAGSRIIKGSTCHSIPGHDEYDTNAMEDALRNATSNPSCWMLYPARQAGSVKAVNVVLLGAAVGSIFALSRDSFLKP